MHSIKICPETVALAKLIWSHIPEEILSNDRRGIDYDEEALRRELIRITDICRSLVESENKPVGH